MSDDTDLIYDPSTRSLRNESTEAITIRTIQRSDPNVDFSAVGANWVMDPGSVVPLNPVRVGPGTSVLTVVWFGTDTEERALEIKVGDEIASPNPPSTGLSREEQIDRAARHFLHLSDRIEELLPPEAELSRDLLYQFAVQLDHDGVAELTPDQIESSLLKSVLGLEKRLIDVERALRARGIL